MENVARILVGLIAAFMLVSGLGFWFHTDTMNKIFALSTLNDLGFASIRADFASFFLAIGLFAGIAAWKRDPHFAASAATLFILALIGRVISLGFEGKVAGGVPPMLLEASSAAILLWARQIWQTS